MQHNFEKDHMECANLSTTHLPWIILGDFKYVTSSEEKKGGTTPNVASMANFCETISTCGLFEPRYGIFYT